MLTRPADAVLALREAEERFRTFFENAPIGECITGPDGRMLRANPAFARMLGYSEADLAELAFVAVTHPDDLTESREGARSLLAGERVVWSMEKRYLRRDGGLVWARVSTRLQRDAKGAPLYFLTHVEDLTERKRLAAEMTARENRYRRQRNALVTLAAQDESTREDLTAALRRITEADAGALEVARVSIWSYNRDRSALECDDLYESTIGRHSSGGALLAATYPAYFSTLSDTDAIVVNDAHRDPRTCEFLELYLRPAGITSMLDATVHVGGETYGVLCHEHVGPQREWTADEKTFAVAMAGRVSLALESWERKRKEDVLRVQSAALNAADHAMVITDRIGAIEWINPAFTQLSGYTEAEALGRNPRELVRSGLHDEAFFKDLWDTILDGRVWRGEMTNRRKDGTRYTEEQSITPVKDARGEITHFIAIKRDLTEEKRLESQYLQAQKMEIVGRLAGGIAHDFNNLLTVINGTAEFGLTALKEGDPLREDFLQIQQAGARAATMTRQLLAFSRKQIMKLEALNLNPVVQGMQGMLQRLIGEDIHLIVLPANDAGCVRGDAGQIEQVVLNLAVNARDAMSNGGELTIETRNVELDDVYAALHPSVKPGPHVMLAVSDTGIGMDAATKARLFEPFFTTKGPGKGTGLGLATVYGIVKQIGGSVWVYSEPGRGSTFKIYLPRVNEVAQASQSTAQSFPSQRGTETVLVVEDEDALRGLATRILRSAGYTVLAASNGESACQLLLHHEGSVDLMFTDMVMPGTSGPELAARIAEAYPAIEVLFTSGYTDDAMLRHGTLGREARFLAKPYSRAALTEAIREALDHPKHLKTGSG